MKNILQFKKVTFPVVLAMTLALGGSAVLGNAERAQAAVGLLIGNPVMAIVGVAAYSAAEFYARGSRDWAELGQAFVVGVIGVTLLDGENGQDIAYVPISSAQAAREIGLTDSEWAAYNSEIDTINLIRQEVAVDIEGTSAQDVEKARKLWVSHQSEISQDAFSAVVKVSQSALKKSK